MIFAIMLAAAALVLTARLRTTLLLDPESITITRAGGVGSCLGPRSTSCGCRDRGCC